MLRCDDAMIDQEGIAILEQHLTEGARRLLKRHEQAKVGEVIAPEDLRERLARVLHAKMEHLDPRGEVWENLTERDKGFFRCCVEAILTSGLVAPTKA